MSDQMNGRTSHPLYVLMTRAVAVGAIVASLTIALIPQTTFAQAAPGNPEAPSSQPARSTVTCSQVMPESEALLGPSQWTAIEITSPDRTNSSELTWQWTTPTSSNRLAAIKQYGFALYESEMPLIRDGRLDADAITYTYTAGTDGHYRFFIWVIEDRFLTASPATACYFDDTELDRVGPIITGDETSYTFEGNQVTPTFATDETGLTYSWTVTADSNAVTPAAATALNPTFTLLKDGTYTFTLTATDTLGNITVKKLTISYEAPFIPNPINPTDPITPDQPVEPIIQPLPVDTFVRPEEMIIQTKKAVLDSHNYGAVAFDVTAPPDTSTQEVKAAVAGDNPPTQTLAVAPIDSSSEGWVIMGVPWYWWLLGAGGVVGGVWWYRNGFLRAPDDA